MGIPGSASPLLLVQAAAAAPAGYEIERSLRFDSSASSFLNRTPEAAGNRKTFTWSGWVKRAKLGTTQSIFTAGTNASTEYDTIEFASNDQIYIYSYSYPNFVYDLRTTQVFRDVSAWYHIVLSVDTTNSTANDRVKLYVNGVRVETFSTNSPPSQNVDSAYWNTANPHYIGYSISRFPADKYLADVHFIDGQALAATDFGEYDANNVWQPKAFTFNNPNNGTTWSSDSSTTIGSAAFDGLTTTNYLTLSSDTITWTPSTGIPYTSLEFASSSGAGGGATDMRYSINGGAEVAFEGAGAATLVTASGTLTSLAIRNTTASNCRWDYVKVNGYMMVDGAPDNSFHLPFSDNSSTIALGTDTSVTVSAAEANKGMDVVTYTGNGGTQTINSLRFAPDFVWIKDRAANGHGLFDTIRGPKVGLFSNLTNGDTTDNDSLTSFLSSGFTLGTGGTTFSSNINGSNYVAWCWKAGGPAVTNTNGSITSQVSANQDYGFSIVTYTGNGTNPSTVGHGLNSAPKFIIHKCRSTAVNWFVYHESAGTGALEGLNTTAAYSSASTAFGSTAPTSSVITTGGDTNTSGRTYVDYCWSEVSGFSKFGSYSGGTNPQTITTGFKPRFLLIKRTDSSASHYVWLLIDSNRGGIKKLAANGSYAENDISYIGDDTQNVVEFLDTGFKLTTTNAASNASGGTYIYAAFASEPGNNWALNNFVANQTSTGFKPVLYSGNDSTQSISGLGFSPDLVWIKSRNQSTYRHRLYDTVRGALNYLNSELTAAESTNQANTLTSFDTDGFTLGSEFDNKGGSNYVAWCWDAGSSTVSNTDGTITSSVRANTDTGFSIATFTSPSSGNFTIGHGLAATPSVVIVKTTGATSDWSVYHASATTTTDKYLVLNSTAGVGTYSTIWGSALPTSSVVGLTSGGAVATSQTCVAYCFAPKPGVSAFGSYTGNGNTSGNGPVVTLGFKPAFLMVKNVSATSDWRIFDSARNPTSPFTKRLYANLSAAESTNSTQEVTFTDNGFQVEASGSVSTYNVSGHTIIYIAFAAPPDGAEIDSLLDSPTEANVDSDTGAGGEVSGNYATLNPLVGGATLSNGNLDYTTTANTATSTIGVTSGKYYAEVTAGGSGAWIGITNNPNERLDSVDTNTIALIDGDGDSYDPSSTQTYTSYSGFSAGDVIGIALDATNLTVDFYVNNTKVKTYTTFTVGGPYFFAIDRSGAVTQTFSWNWGQRPFAFAAPTGYQPLTTALLDDPTIADGSTAMDVALWSGSASAQSITGLNHSPDFVWIKRRNSAQDHRVFDVIRGAEVGLTPNYTNGDYTATGELTAFNSDGYSLGTQQGVNSSGNTYVGWSWDGGSSTVSNTDGSITSSVRANASAGFSIVTYTSSSSVSTVGHGLNAAPYLIITKNRSVSNTWWTYHESLGNTKALRLDATDAAATMSSTWNNTSPTSSVFTVGGEWGNGNNIVAYCWAPVEGYSAFGSYTGNGSDDGSFVFTNMRSSFVMIKRTDTTGAWFIYDDTRPGYNVQGGELYANFSDSEDTTANIDLLSNGFKLRRGASAGLNASGGTYIFASFASNPFKTSRAR